MRKTELRALSLEELEAQAASLYSQRVRLKDEEGRVAAVIAEKRDALDRERLEADAQAMRAAEGTAG